MVEATLWYVENKGLFSNHYLQNQLLTRDEWKKPQGIEEAFVEIKDLYLNKKSIFPSASEGQLRENFLNVVLEHLGHHYAVGGKTEGARKFPDYGLFPDEKTADAAIEYQGTEDFYKTAISICEAKAWEVNLDERDPRNVESDKRTPNAQIDEYLRWTEKKWGILTNGRFWRLYYRENSYRNYFYQIDLAKIIEEGDINAFKYFFLFFRREAFEPDVNNICFLDRVYQGSVDYAKDIGKNLEENVYKAMKTLAEGFIKLDENKLKIEDDLNIIQENTMILLYRLLFIFFAEAKGFLDISKKTPASENYAKDCSLDSLKKKIKNSIKTGENIPKYRFSYWDQLQTLFKYINKGTEAFNIPKEELYIPSYNGGLFDTEKNRFLSEKKIGDHYLAKAIDLLASSEGKKPEERGFIDYSSLDIRHLGSVYEGLLEYKLKLATEPMVAVKEKGKEKWIPESEFKGKKPIDRVDANEIYLATDKGERKATGSYYTPEYIVKYIVENTLTPIVEEKMNNAIKNNEKCSDAILSIKVLDPAMGSGHFLVEAVDFLGHYLGDAINKDIERGLMKEGEYSDDWLRREIVSHCIYGVDLNPMAVELAKVSLWLKTISKDKPLSFLDHRLKCGNSLIGAKLIDLPWYPKLKEKDVDRAQKRLDIPEGFIKKLVDTIKKISDISDETLDNIKKKEVIFNEFKNTREYDMIKTLADVRTSIYFGNQIEEKTYGMYSGDVYYSSESEWKERREKWFAQKGREIAKNKHFFHWELEFPEIFFEEGKIKENPGFDAVVGNPPYGASLDENDRTYLGLNYETAAGYKNTGLQFIERSYLLLMENGACGLIVPKSLTYSQGWNKGAELILPGLNYLIDASKAFEDVLLEQVVIVFSKHQTNYDFYKSSSFTQSEVSKYVLIPKKSYTLCGTLISSITPREFEIYNKMNLQDHYFKNVSITFRGVPWQKFLCSTGNTRILRGDHIERFRIIDSYDFVDLDKINVPKTKIELLKQPKIVSQNIVAHVAKPLPHIIIMSTFDKNGLLNLDTVNNTVLTNNDYAYGYLLCILNCILTSWYTYRFIYNQAIRTMHFDESYVGKIPLRRISFTTPKEEREKLVGELKQKYQDEKFDEILKTVEECLPKDKEGNFITEKEKSDVIHDFLAFLAEQMIEMNKEKQSEVKGFIEWLEREINAKIDDLSNKTAIKEYYKSNFNRLIEVLKKDKKKIPINLSNRDFQMNFEKEYDKSMAKLNPLMKKIESTDNLIDQIVYKLYGLTDDEIRIVEESFNRKHVNTKEEFPSNEG